MRLAYPPYGLNMLFEEGKINVLIVENPAAVRNMLGDIWRQAEGGVGEWILSEDEKILAFSKSVACVYNVFSLDYNEKRILNKVYSEINELALSEYAVETAELNGKIVEYLDKLLINTPYYLEYKLELELGGLLKLYDVKFGIEDMPLLERLINYVKITNMVLRPQVYVFLNLKQMFSTDEIDQFYEVIRYEKVNVLLLEQTDNNVKDVEKHWIIDPDLCMIIVEN